MVKEGLVVVEGVRERGNQYAFPSVPPLAIPRSICGPSYDHGRSNFELKWNSGCCYRHTNSDYSPFLLTCCQQDIFNPPHFCVLVLETDRSVLDLRGDTGVKIPATLYTRMTQCTPTQQQDNWEATSDWPLCRTI